MSEHGQLRLGVNIDHVATLRQLRGTPYPDLVEAARCCLAAGAYGITVHLREDRRHIQDADVVALRAVPGMRLNLEMAVVPEIIEFACRVRPDEVCLVPERRQERTTEGGLDVVAAESELRECVHVLSQVGIRVSLFVEPDPEQLEAAGTVGAPCVELHTGAYSLKSGAEARRELERLIEAARYGHRLGLQINAGHGLHRGNLPGLLEVPYLDTLNIGHSIVCDAVFMGLEKAVRTTLAILAQYRGGRQ